MRRSSGLKVRIATGATVPRLTTFGKAAPGTSETDEGGRRAGYGVNAKIARRIDPVMSVTAKSQPPPAPATLPKGFADLIGGVAAHELWSFMGWQDIRQRYRRTILGPWWLAISTAMLVLFLGFLWSEIFAVNVEIFMPFFVIGYVLWTFLSGVIAEATTAFTQFEGLILQRRIPFSAYLYRIGMRHAIILLHNASVVVLILILFGSGPSWNYLLAIPGLLIFAAATLMASIPVAILCTRFRDMPQVVTNVLQVAFFATPIMWRPDSLVRFRWMADLNPFAHLVNVVRAPLLGAVPSIEAWVWSLGSLTIAVLAGAWLLGRYGHRIAYWL